MLLIQSSKTDASTFDVIDWLRFLYPDTDYLRINDATIIKKVSHRISNYHEHIELEMDDNAKINTALTLARWYRRGYLEFLKVPPDQTSKDYWCLSTAIRDHLEKEFQHVEEGLDTGLNVLTKSINRFIDNNTNKINNLRLASSLQLKIPDTLITNDIRELKQFCRQYGSIITKAFSQNFFKVDFHEGIIAGLSLDTTLVAEPDMVAYLDHQGKGLPLPAFYQEYIEKAYELRIFFLNGQLYPMAIFSQANEKTKIDFRSYDMEHPNRCVPYYLPEAISTKIVKMMSMLSLNSGSIDMIVTPEREYVFLEVNPIGKYQWLRQNCNYDIDRQIAHYLAGTEITL